MGFLVPEVSDTQLGREKKELLVSQEIYSTGAAAEAIW